jgi:hypothetical protein
MNSSRYHTYQAGTTGTLFSDWSIRTWRRRMLHPSGMKQENGEGRGPEPREDDQVFEGKPLSPERISVLRAISGNTRFMRI